MRDFAITGLICAFVCTATSAQDAVRLELKTLPDTRLTYKSEEKLEQTAIMQGFPVKTTMSGTETTEVTTGKAKNGEVREVRVVKHLASTVKASGMELIFDSRAPDKTKAPAPLQGLLDALKASTRITRTYVFKNDKLSKVEIGGLKPAEIPAALKTELDPAKLKADHLEQRSILPAKPVAAGATWEKESSVPIPGGQKLKTKTKYTYVGLVEHKPSGRKLDRIDTQILSTELVLAPNSPLTAQGISIKKSSLKPTGKKGSIWFDRQLGRIFARNQLVHCKGSVSIEARGQLIKQDLELTISNKVSIVKPKAPSAR